MRSSHGRLAERPTGEGRRHARSESRFRVPEESPTVPALPSEFANKEHNAPHYHEAEALLASQPWLQKPVQTPRTGWDTSQPEELVRKLRHGTPEEKAVAAKKAEGLARRVPEQREMLAAAIPAVIAMLSSSKPPTAAETAAALVRTLAGAAELKTAILRAGAVKPLVRLVEERGSGAAQEALDRLSLCDAAVKAQVERALTREGPAVLVEAVRQAQQTASGREAEELRALGALAADAEDAVQLAAAGGVALLVEVLGRGTARTLQVAVPADVLPGATIQVDVGSGSATLYDVVVPAGVRPGETLEITVGGGPGPGAAEPQEREAVAAAAAATWALLEHPPLRTPAVQAGAIAPLVALLAAAAEEHGAAVSAAGALCALARSQAHRQAVLDAGALRPLLALLGGGTAAAEADEALDAVRRAAGETLLARS